MKCTRAFPSPNIVTTPSSSPLGPRHTITRERSRMCRPVCTGGRGLLGEEREGVVSARDWRVAWQRRQKARRGARSDA